MSAERAIARHTPAIVVGAVLLALGLLVLGVGPAWLERMSHPLKYRGEIIDAARRHRVDPYLIAAVINAESGFDPTVVSEAGAVGLMQVMPETAEALGDTDRTAVPTNRDALLDPQVNVELGTLYLRQLLTRFRDERLALAAYNAGATRVDEWRAAAGKDADPMSVISFPVTREYVRRVIEESREYERLYPDDFPDIEQTAQEGGR